MRIPQLLSAVGGQPQAGQKPASLMPAPWMRRVQAVVAKLLDIDDGAVGIGHPHRAIVPRRILFAPLRLRVYTTLESLDHLVGADKDGLGDGEA